jgi:flagellar basal body-associated protein FliL
MSKKKKNPDIDSNKNNASNKDDNNDNSYFARGRKKRKQYLKIIVPVVVGIAALAIVLAIFFPSEDVADKYGALGSAHEHAAVLINLNGTTLDLEQQKYMVRSNYIHV